MRSSRTDWDLETIARTYWRLTEIEPTFRSLKSEPGLRPVWHRKPERIGAHLFVAVLADHGVHLLRRKLRAGGIHHSWRAGSASRRRCARYKDGWSRIATTRAHGRKRRGLRASRESSRACTAAESRGPARPNDKFCSAKCATEKSVSDSFARTYKFAKCGFDKLGVRRHIEPVTEGDSGFESVAEDSPVFRREIEARK